MDILITVLITAYVSVALYVYYLSYFFEDYWPMECFLRAITWPFEVFFIFKDILTGYGRPK